MAFRPKTVLPAVASTVVCALLLYYPADVRQHFIIPGPVARIYATILGFVIAFRTRMAFGRFFEGVSHAQIMLSQWRDAFLSLSCFIEASIVEHQRMGHVEVVRELVLSKARLVHWFSLIVALAVQKLRGEEGEIGSELVIERSAPVNRFRWKGGAEMMGASKSAVAAASKSLRESFQLRPAFDDGCEDLREEANRDYQSGVQILGNITDEEASQLAEAHDVLLCITKWILLEISSLSITGRLLIAPPILSRVYQELSNAMLAFFQAMQIPLCPFPFPFAQFLQYGLLWWICLCPFAVLPTLDDPAPDLSRTWMSLPLNYLACFGFVALNEIAIELEEPFGEDANDYPVHQQQWNVVWAIEDCYFTDVPSDFTLDTLGEDAMELAAHCKMLAQLSEKNSTPPPPPAAPTAPPPPTVPGVLPSPPPPETPLPPSVLPPQMALSPSSGTPENVEQSSSRDVAALATKFEELRDTIDTSVQVMQSCGAARHNDLARVAERLDALPLGLKVPTPTSAIEPHFNRKQHGPSVSWDRALADPRINKFKSTEFAELRDLVKTHRQISEALQALVAEHRRSKTSALVANTDAAPSHSPVVAT